jgi:peroxiredoxin
VPAAQAQETFQLEWRPAGITERGSGFRPHSVRLQAEAPAGLKRAPEGVGSPRYGVIEMGPAKAPAKFIVLVEAPADKPARLWLDTNANGDLTDDPPGTITNRPYKTRDGEDATAWQATAQVQIPFPNGPRTGTLKFYAGPTATAGRTQPLMLQYYADHGAVGEVRVAGRAVPVVLQDAGATGAFRVGQDTMRNPLLWLGLTNATTGRVGVSTPVTRPFEVGGQWWAVTNLSPEGAFQIVAAAKPVTTETKPLVDLSPGRPAPAFTATLTSGKALKFPEDYKGKVVLVDFWATWCGPCIAELPNVTAAYKQYHAQGLEILGISLDREDMAAKLAEFTAKRDMPWPQVYDGKFWQAEVAKLYGIRSIPHMLLVDGDSGRIVANKNIRGEALAPAIEAALAARKK